jgi:hypothetical protein
MPKIARRSKEILVQYSVHTIDTAKLRTWDFLIKIHFFPSRKVSFHSHAHLNPHSTVDLLVDLTDRSWNGQSQKSSSGSYGFVWRDSPENVTKQQISPCRCVSTTNAPKLRWISIVSSVPYRELASDNPIRDSRRLEAPRVTVDCPLLYCRYNNSQIFTYRAFPVEF